MERDNSDVPHPQIIGDDTLAIDSVLKADVWREVLLKEERELNAKLNTLEAQGDEKRFEDEKEELSNRLTEVHQRLADMEAETGPARAAALLAGTSFLHSYLDQMAEFTRPGIY